MIDVDAHAGQADAMEAYFDGDGPAGRVMMASTAAVQVSLDAGADERDVRRRWPSVGRVALLVGERIPVDYWVSAGMSGDLETAVACGATHLRVGTAIMGSRR